MLVFHNQLFFLISPERTAKKGKAPQSVKTEGMGHSKLEQGEIFSDK